MFGLSPHELYINLRLLLAMLFMLAILEAIVTIYAKIIIYGRT